MLVFGHPSRPYVGATGATVDPDRQIKARVASFFGADADKIMTVVEDARTGVPRGAGLVVVPDVADVECSPPQASLTWSGEMEEVRFLLRAGAHREGTTIEGSVRVFCGALVIAEAAVEFAVVGDAASPAPLREQATVSYRRIFPCFSPRDVDLVTNVAAVAEALGDRYTIEVIEGHHEGAPDEWMLPLIERADVFQLFWSTNSMHSTSCQRQWETALATGRSGFIRPLFWEDPFPRAQGLPPPALQGLRFIRLPSWTDAARTTTDPLWRGTPRDPGAHVTPAPSGPSMVPPTAPSRPVSPRRYAWAGGTGLAAVVGLFAAAIAAAVTATVPGGATTPVPTTTPGPPPVQPGGEGGASSLVVVAVAAGAFVLAFVLTLLVIRRRRATGSRRRPRTASSAR
jgi:hypothetical protein